MKITIKSIVKGISTALVVALAVAAGTLYTSFQIREQQKFFDNDVRRFGIALKGETITSSIMGAIKTVSLIDSRVRDELIGRINVNRPDVHELFRTVTLAYDIEGIFIFGTDGIIRTSWYTKGITSTGIDINFRPYYQMAMKGIESMYAAVSITNGTRNLYFTTPVFAGANDGKKVIGGISARVSIDKINRLLNDMGDDALLVSPQGVVFTSQESRWNDQIITAVDQETLESIRKTKQFGKVFEKSVPEVVPFNPQKSPVKYDRHRYLVSEAVIEWNDPQGNWRLFAMKDLSTSIPPYTPWLASVFFFLFFYTLYLIAVKTAENIKHQKESQYLKTIYDEKRISLFEKKTLVSKSTFAFQDAGDVIELGKIYLSELHHLTGMLEGSVYTADTKNESVVICAGFGISSTENSILPDESIVLKAFHEKRAYVLTGDDTGAYLISSGLGSTKPALVYIFPVQYKSSTAAVVRLSFAVEPDNDYEEIVSELSGYFVLNLKLLSQSMLIPNQGDNQ